MGWMRGRAADPAGVDWEERWHRYQDSRARPNGSAAWDKRAGSYGARSDGAYEQEFLRRAAVRAGERVLDMGCGTGLLAVPLAQRGCRVTCADFSDAMLAATRQAAREAGVDDLVQTVHLAWDDDWEAAGVAPGSFDVALASRSIATYHLTDALRKLDAAAARRVCVTLASGRSPCRDERAFAAVGRARAVVADHQYALNILFDHGVYPELSYIESSKRPGFPDKASAHAELAYMLGGDLTAQESAALDAFLDEHYAVDPDAKGPRRYASDALRVVRWAFISWGASEATGLLG